MMKKKKIGCVSKLQISLMDCPCLTNLSQSLHDAKENFSIVGKNELTAQKRKIRAKEDKKWWSIWCHEHFQKTSFKASYMMIHDNFYEYFVGAEKHEFQNSVPGT